VIVSCFLFLAETTKQNGFMAISKNKNKIKKVSWQSHIVGVFCPRVLFVVTDLLKSVDLALNVTVCLVESREQLFVR